MSAQIEIAGRVVRYLEGGNRASRNVLVLLHAFPLGVRLWEPQLEAFPDWRAIAPALPGFDGSDRVPRPSVETYAGVVLSLLDALGISRAVFAGVSMGGYVTFAVHRQAPNRAAGLILADTRSAADKPEAREGRLKMIETVRRQGPPAVAAEMLPKLLGETTPQRRPDLVARVNDLIDGQTTDGIADAVEVLMSRPDSTPQLARVNVPTLALAGEQDTLTPADEMEAMARAIRGSRFVRIADAGHLANLEAPDVFNREVAQFLRALPAEGIAGFHSS